MLDIKHERFLTIGDDVPPGAFGTDPYAPGRVRMTIARATKFPTVASCLSIRCTKTTRNGLDSAESACLGPASPLQTAERVGYARLMPISTKKAKRLEAD